MKKILLFFAVLISYSLSAQIVITMEEEGGVYKVPCVVNGAKMKFIFDTGASYVSLSESMAEYLSDNGFIKKEDFVGKGKSVVADGRSVDVLVVNLRDIEIGGFHLRDVKASIVIGQKAPLLLGQSAIQKLGSISIKGNKLYINQTGKTISDSDAEAKVHNAQMLYDKDNSEGVVSLISEIETYNNKYYKQHTDDILLMYSVSLFNTQQYAECIRVLDEFKVYKYEVEIEGKKKNLTAGWDNGVWDMFLNLERLNIKNPDPSYLEKVFTYYKIYGRSLFLLGQEKDAITYLNRCNIMYGSIQFDYQVGEDDVINNRIILATCYQTVGNLVEAKSLYEKSIKERYSYLGKTEYDVDCNRVKDGLLGDCYMNYSYVIAEYYDYTATAMESFIQSVKKAAKCGNTTAINICKEKNIAL